MKKRKKKEKGFQLAEVKERKENRSESLKNR